LAERLAEGYRFIEKFPEEESSSGDLQRVSMFIESDRFFGRKYLIDELEKHLRDNNKKKPSPALKMLAALPFKIIVTTNFDLLLDNALQEAGKTPVRIVYNPSLGKPTKDMVGVPTEERPLLFKMHGDLDQRESIVITDEDYITFIQRMSEKESAHPVPRTVRTGMMTWPTLFVGYSLRDYNLRLLFRTLRWKVDKANFPISFAVDRKPDPLIMQVWEHERRFVAFIVEDLWTFVPGLYKEVQGKEYPA
jgi:hypothetical protein